jgi:hypothetical protein
VQGFFQNDFIGLTFENYVLNGVSLGPPISGRYVVENTYEISMKRSKWTNLGVIFGMAVFYRFVFFVMIKIAEDVRPALRYMITKYYNQCRRRKQRRMDLLEEP